MNMTFETKATAWNEKMMTEAIKCTIEAIKSQIIQIASASFYYASVLKVTKQPL